MRSWRGTRPAGSAAARAAVPGIGQRGPHVNLTAVTGTCASLPCGSIGGGGPSKRARRGGRDWGTAPRSSEHGAGPSSPRPAPAPLGAPRHGPLEAGGAPSSGSRLVRSPAPCRAYGSPSELEEDGPLGDLVGDIAEPVVAQLVGETRRVLSELRASTAAAPASAESEEVLATVSELVGGEGDLEARILRLRARLDERVVAFLEARAATIRAALGIDGLVSGVGGHEGGTAGFAVGTSAAAGLGGGVGVADRAAGTAEGRRTLTSDEAAAEGAELLAERVRLELRRGQAPPELVLLDDVLDALSPRRLPRVADAVEGGLGEGPGGLREADPAALARDARERAKRVLRVGFGIDLATDPLTLAQGLAARAARERGVRLGTPGAGGDDPDAVAATPRPRAWNEDLSREPVRLGATAGLDAPPVRPAVFLAGARELARRAATGRRRLADALRLLAQGGRPPQDWPAEERAVLTDLAKHPARASALLERRRDREARLDAACRLASEVVREAGARQVRRHRGDDMGVSARMREATG